LRKEKTFNAQIDALTKKIKSLHRGISDAKKQEKDIKANNIGFASKTKRKVVVEIHDVENLESLGMIDTLFVIAVKNHGPKDLTGPFYSKESF